MRMRLISLYIFFAMITISCYLRYSVSRQFFRIWWTIWSHKKAFLAKGNLRDFLQIPFKKTAIFFDSWIAVEACFRIFSKVEKFFFFSKNVVKTYWGVLKKNSRKFGNKYQYHFNAYFRVLGSFYTFFLRVLKCYH